MPKQKTRASAKRFKTCMCSGGLKRFRATLSPFHGKKLRNNVVIRKASMVHSGDFKRIIMLLVENNRVFVRRILGNIGGNINGTC